MTPQLERTERVPLPELGPSLGRVASPAVDPKKSSRLWRQIREVRLGLATALFESGHAARGALAAGDLQQAARRLGRETWAVAWARAVADVGRLVVDDINRRLEAAAREARMPRRRMRAVLVTESEGHALTARLAGGAGRLVTALDELEAIAVAPGAEASSMWVDTMLRVARRLEDAWLALEAHVDRELERWGEEVERIRAWRRPRWPLWTVTLVVVGLATYAGLLLGGYLAAPEPFQPIVEWWWARW